MLECAPAVASWAGSIKSQSVLLFFDGAIRNCSGGLGNPEFRMGLVINVPIHGGIRWVEQIGEANPIDARVAVNDVESGAVLG
jgi:hypothetical protein